MMCLTQAHFYLHTFAFYPDRLTANKSLLVAILFESKSLTRHFNNLSLNLTSRLVLNFRTVNFNYSQNTKYLQLKLQGLCNTLLSECGTYETLKNFEIFWHLNWIVPVFPLSKVGFDCQSNYKYDVCLCSYQLLTWLWGERSDCVMFCRATVASCHPQTSGPPTLTDGDVLLFMNLL